MEQTEIVLTPAERLILITGIWSAVWRIIWA